MQLKIVKEAREALRRELLEVRHWASELEAVIEAARKEALKLRRVQAELVNKKLVGRAGDELRALVKGAKNDKTELARGHIRVRVLHIRGGRARHHGGWAPAGRTRRCGCCACCSC